MLAVLITPALPAVEALPRNMGEVIPARAHAALWVDSVPGAREDARANPFFRLLTDDVHGVGGGVQAVSRVLGRIPISAADPLGGAWDMVLPMVGFGIENGLVSATSVFHFTARDIEDTFTGSVAVYSTLYDLYVERGIEIVEWDVVLQADYKDSERPAVEKFLEKSLARVPASAKRRTVEYDGVPAYQITYYLEEQATLPGDPPTAPGEILKEFEVVIEYAWVDNTFILAEGRGTPVRTAIRALRTAGAGERLAETAGYRRAAELLSAGGTGRFHLYVDLARQNGELRDFPSQQAELASLTALGLSDGGPLLARLGIDATGTRLDVALATMAEPRGLFALAGQSPENTLEALRLVPPDAKTFGTVSIDIGRAWGLAQTAYELANPRLGAYLRSSVALLTGATGIRVQEDLIDRARGEVVSYMREDPDTPAGERRRPASGLFIPITSTQETVNQMNEVLRQLTTGDVRTVDLMATDVDGVMLWEPAPGPQGAAPFGLHVAAMPQGLAVAGTPTEARELLRRVRGQDTGTITAKPSVARILGGVDRAGLRGFVYTSGRALADDLISAANRMRITNGPGEADLRAALGDSWWTLHSTPSGMRFRFVIESNQTP